MAEYIEREAVCSDCKNQKVCVDKSVCPVGRAPAADVEAVKHGRWEERPVNVGTCTTGLFCSECNFPSLGWRYNYCPNCGAKMNLEVTNGLDQH